MDRVAYLCEDLSSARNLQRRELACVVLDKSAHAPVLGFSTMVPSAAAQCPPGSEGLREDLGLHADAPHLTVLQVKLSSPSGENVIHSWHRGSCLKLSPSVLLLFSILVKGGVLPWHWARYKSRYTPGGPVTPGWHLIDLKSILELTKGNSW